MKISRNNKEKRILIFEWKPYKLDALMDASYSTLIFLGTLSLFYKIKGIIDSTGQQSAIVPSTIYGTDSHNSI